MNCGPTIVTERINELTKMKWRIDAEIAKGIGVNVKTVKNWLSGKSEANPQNTIKLACYFDTHYDYIIGESDEINPPKLPKSAKLIAFMEMVSGKFYSADCIEMAPTNKLIACYITSNFDKFLYATYGKVRFQLPNYNYNKEK